MRPLRVGGTSNHIHIALVVSPAIAVAKAMQLIKGGSSKWINERPGRARFEWQAGYGAFTIGVSQITRTVAYIDNQREHHSRQSFEDEYVGFLKKHGVEFEEKYVFD